MLKISNLTKSYGPKQVLNGVDLTVAPGEILGLVGANGAGKSTLISLATGLQTPDAGSIHINGIDVTRDRVAAAAHIGVAPQDLGIYPTLTARANLSAFARLAGLGRRQAAKRVAEIADALDLNDVLSTLADRLSGGQKRRLHTGMAIVGSPRLLFLDEPTVGADVQSRAQILDLVTDLAANGTAIVYTSHYLTEFEQLGATIAVLHGGTIVERGSVTDLVARWADTRVRLSFTKPTAASPPGWIAEGTDLVSSGTSEDPANMPFDSKGSEAAASSSVRRTAATGMTAAPAEPGVLIAAALAQLGPAASTLTAVRIEHANLEAAYLAITARSTDPSFETQRQHRHDREQEIHS